MAQETLRRLIIEVPDWPKAGVTFYDITPALADAEAFRTVISGLADSWRDRGITHVVGVESRGFIFGAALALELGLGLVIVRKPGKLPRATIKAKYELEYGTDEVQLHCDSLPAGAKALVIDDVLATGGTAAAVCELVQQSDGELSGIGFVIELDFLAGRAKLPAGVEVQTILHY